MGVFRFAGGALASLHSSWTEWNEYMYLEIYGKEGYLRVDDRQPQCLTTLGRKDGHRGRLRLLQGATSVLCSWSSTIS